nr:MAG TPA: hypothetical protein [Caudoviricetes sp.]
MSLKSPLVGLFLCLLSFHFYLCIVFSSVNKGSKQRCHV